MTDPDPVAPPTEVLPPAGAQPPTEAAPRTRRLSRKAVALIVAGAAVLVAGGIVTGVLVASSLDAQSAAIQLREAQQDAKDAAAALTKAQGAVDAGTGALTTRIAQVDAALAVTGAGIDEDARTALQQARDAAQAALDDGVQAEEPAAPSGSPDTATTPAAQRELAEAYRKTADARKAAAADAKTRTTALQTALDDLGDGIGAYLTATTTAGAALLAERSDAADDTKAALQAQLDALGGTAPADLADALGAYRQAIDDVVSSSDVARNPSPGGTGTRVPDPASLTAVVNKRRGLPADYVPPGLVTPANIPGATQVRSELIGPLEQMRQDMAAAGITLRMSSGYRSYARQQVIYNGFVASEGVAGADTHSARPGNSEHQTGLAVDLDDGTGCNLARCFANTPGGQWLAANSWKYGFILRYGDGWQPIVGYSYEPWHFRYVGVEVATDMHNRGIRTLEEYYGLPAAPDYG